MTMAAKTENWKNKNKLMLAGNKIGGRDEIYCYSKRKCKKIEKKSVCLGSYFIV